MKCVLAAPVESINKNFWLEIEKKYNIVVREGIKTFFELNGGGYPMNGIIISDGEEYEVRYFLSLDENDKNYYIGKPLNYFLDKTKGKIIPIGIDSGDNYYCVNNETGRVYYWSASEDHYFCIAENIDSFLKLFESK